MARRLGLAVREDARADGSRDVGLYSTEPELTYRYAFARWWGDPALSATTTWIGLNPATGDTDGKPRPTLDRCIQRTRLAGHRAVLFVNLFAFRATQPRCLREASDPVGPRNDEVLRAVVVIDRRIAAWGSGGTRQGRDQQVARELSGLMCLGTTSKGQPRHPLYVSAATELVPWP